MIRTHLYSSFSVQIKSEQKPKIKSEHQKPIQFRTKTMTVETVCNGKNSYDKTSLKKKKACRYSLTLVFYFSSKIGCNNCREAVCKVKFVYFGIHHAVAFSAGLTTLPLPQLQLRTRTRSTQSFMLNFKNKNS